MDKDEWLKSWGFHGRVAEWRKRGAELTEAQEALLAEASWQSCRKVNEKKRPKPMTGAQRAMKADLLSSWRTGLENLRFVDDAFPHGKEATAWFREKDLRKVLEKDTVVRLVRMCAYHFGTEYADEILEALRSTYDMAGEQIVLQRALTSWGGFRPGLRQ